MKRRRQVPDFDFRSTTFAFAGYDFPCDPDTGNDCWTVREPWLKERFLGASGSAQLLAQTLKHSLMAAELLSFGPLPAPICQEIEHNFGLAIELLINGDSKFYRTIADGLEACENNDPLKPEEPRIFLCLAARYYENQDPDHLPTKNQVVALAKRIWALARLRGGIKEALGLLSQPLEPALEKQIAAKIKDLPQVKWSRALRVLAQQLPCAKPGPKKQAAASPAKKAKLKPELPSEL
jgi:hypothetical protein